MRLPNDLITSVSGFRGRVGSVLTPELIARIAAAFGAFLREGSAASGAVVVGRDSRTSGAMFAEAAISGLLSVGCDVVDAGLVPTPTLLLAVQHHRGAGGIAVTASHNPADWNALKLAGAEGMFLDADAMARFQMRLREDEVPRARWDGLGTRTRDGDCIARHVRRILDLPYVDSVAIAGRRFRVGLDCVHGAGGAIMPALLKALGCEVVGIDLETDGLFPRDPEPTAANLGGLRALVREAGVDLGLAVDPDVDRLSLVDEAGRPLGEDLTLALAAAVVLRRKLAARAKAPKNARAQVVTNLSTSRVVEDVAKTLGAELIRAPVGEINVARRMQQTGAVVGGEGNGGVILGELHYTRDAPLAAALVLQHLVDTGASLSQAAESWPSYSIVKEKLTYPREALPAAYELLVEQAAGAKRDSTDGLHLDWAEQGRWLHVRPSGTEPVIRIIAEARSVAEAREMTEGVRNLLRQAEASVGRETAERT